MARVNIIVFTITVLWICNSVTESVQQDSNNNVKKHDGHIDVLISEDLAAHDNGLSHGDDTASPNIIDSRRKLSQGQLGPKNLQILGVLGATIAGELLGRLFGRNLEPMAINKNDYDDKKFSTYYGTPLERGYGRGWGKAPRPNSLGPNDLGLLPNDFLDIMNELMARTSATKERLKKKHSVGSISILPFDEKYSG